MRIGLKANTLSTAQATVRTRPEITPSIYTSERLLAISRTAPKFPESALISGRPLRYNVQLNRQLTAIQKAENYLLKAEEQLLILRHKASYGNGDNNATAINSLLQYRRDISGGTVDRNFCIKMQERCKVSFTLPSMERILSAPEDETLVFALGGRKRELTAVLIPAKATVNHIIAKLNVGLGRLNIQAIYSERGKMFFQVDEEHWIRVSHQLSVRGEGKLFSADEFTRLLPCAETCREDDIRQLTKQWGPDASSKLQKTIDQITLERGKLYQHQELVSARINDMSTNHSLSEVQETSKALSAALANSGLVYKKLFEVLGAQANISQAMVNNLLAE